MIHDKKRVNALQAAAKAGIEALEELRNKTTVRSKRPFVPDRTMLVSDPDVSSAHPSAWLLLLLKSGPTTLIMRVVVYSLSILLGVVYYLDE